ncbi:MAG TPA: J domain-containing protein [Ardenticatenaceae bacterium]|nr:J domain-containing protein [Ardenticatenaceae bacterium]
MYRSPTFYDHLGVAPEADFGELRRAYQHAVERCHPDRFASASPAVRAQAEAEMHRVVAAWEILSDVRRRAAYDKSLQPSLNSQTMRNKRG